MTRRGRLVLGGALLVAALVGGRWGAVLVADRWWAMPLSPAAAGFLTDLHLLRLVLDVAATLLATTWFAGHCLVVVRAIASISVRRAVADGEVREQVAPRTLVLGAVAAAAILGVLVGGDASRFWPEVVTAWAGVRIGTADPLLGRDAGVYVAQLPLWRLAHGFAVVLTLLAVGAVAMLYVVIGAVRWIGGRPAISDHARVHLGWTLAAFAATVAWGAALAPASWVGGVARDAAPFTVVAVTGPLLAGVAAFAALASVVWAITARHGVFAGAWLAVVLVWFGGRVVAPVAARGARTPVDDEATRALVAAAWGLEGLREAPARTPGVAGATLSLWTPPTAARAWGGAGELLALDPAPVRVGGRRRPAWLVVASDSTQGLVVAALADDRVGPAGEPLFWPAGDTVPVASPVPLLTLGPSALRPGAAEVLVGPDVPGAPVGGWLERVALAWALQEPRLLRTPAVGTRVAWQRSPLRRLARLAPFAEWSAPAARVVDDRLVWVATGAVSADAFPLAPRLLWQGRSVGSARAAFVGAVDAETGATRLWRRADAGPLGLLWDALADGVLEGPEALPPELADLAPVPAELALAQAVAAQRLVPDVGRLAGVSDTARGELPGVGLLWSRDTLPGWASLYERERERRLDAVLVTAPREGRLGATLLRLDSASVIPAPSSLEYRWGRFPTFVQLADSAAAAQGRLESGPLRVALGDGGPVPYQVHYGRRVSGPAVAWVSLAAGERLGAGRHPAEAWDNLRGARSPAPPGLPGGEPSGELRRWFRAADSALRRGDFSAFGRAWEALREVLEAPGARR